LFDPAGCAYLDRLNAVLVDGDQAYGVHHARELAWLRRGQAYAEVLHHPGIDGHAAGGGGGAGRCHVRHLRHQLHVHERRLARMIEVLVRVHRVVPVKRLVFGIGDCRSGRH